jgi:hypothetical protein
MGLIINIKFHILTRSVNHSTIVSMESKLYKIEIDNNVWVPNINDSTQSFIDLPHLRAFLRRVKARKVHTCTEYAVWMFGRDNFITVFREGI